MAPFSDLDLLFLRPYKQTPFSESVTEYLLYVLWDLGLKVGQSSRNLDECIKLARQDYTIQTALLEARCVAGDESLAGDLSARYRKDVAERGHAEFIAAKLKERDARHVRIGASRYMVEPNIKEGKGGLRDLHTLFWMARRRYGFTDAARIHRCRHIHGRGISCVSPRLVVLVERVRCHLHFVAGRAEEKLTFDLQPELAKRLGYNARAGQSAVERFMKRYFLVAKEVGGLTRILCAKLEADHAKTAPRALQRFWPARADARRVAVAPGFHVDGGRLCIDSPAVFDAPANLMGLFATAEARDLDIHPIALREAARRVRRAPPNWRRDDTGARRVPERGDLAAKPRRRLAADERSRRARAVRARVRPRRRPDAVQHVPPLHG